MLLPLPDAVQGDLRFWLRAGETLAAWHRYGVVGIEKLDVPGPKLLIAYHGRGLATDMIVLSSLLYQRHGRLPHSFLHGAFAAHPRLAAFNVALGFVTADGPDVAAAAQRGEDFILLPGGTREANRTWKVRYKVDWGKRAGFLRMALTHGLTLVPIAAAGVDSTYIGLTDGYEVSKRLNLPERVPGWLAVGPLGLFPPSPPFPVRVLQVIGDPIDPLSFGVAPDDRDGLSAASMDIQRRIQALLDHARDLKRRNVRDGVQTFQQAGLRVGGA
jgi:1-acyl-sn-glycerol-3-phosphate acyltransferase